MKGERDREREREKESVSLKRVYCSGVSDGSLFVVVVVIVIAGLTVFGFFHLFLLGTLSDVREPLWQPPS